MYGIILPRPAMALKPTPAWQTTFNSALISTDKAGGSWGYRRTPTPVIGSIVDGTVDSLGGVQIQEIALGVSFMVVLVGSLPNSGWEYLFAKDKVLLRSAMTYSVTGGNTSWITPIPIVEGAPKPDYTTTETNILIGFG